MTVRELIAELERFDPVAPVVVATGNGARDVIEIGRRARPLVGAHPQLYLGGDERGTSQ